ncbi:MAG: UbiA prenyltransferase family protein, partial [Oscillospiraceae bacterium]|nr:UbiA prenyltransferase family protein [Oscillospiraceae bacterium]
MKQYLKLIRVHHYMKNLLVLAALACSGQFFDEEKLIPGVMGFLAFCMISSVIYIINDISDADNDRLHPLKSARPIASGAVSPKKAALLAALLLILSLVFNFVAYKLYSSILLLIFLLLNIAYSLGLKDIPILDICILAAGFLIRVMYGAIISGIEISNWLYLTVIAMAFYFSLGKRRNELRRMGEAST